jgi:hypothetical protein
MARGNIRGSIKSLKTVVPGRLEPNIMGSFRMGGFEIFYYLAVIYLLLTLVSYYGVRWLYEFLIRAGFEVLKCS